jgi:hypothetical protein
MKTGFGADVEIRQLNGRKSKEKRGAEGERRRVH